MSRIRNWSPSGGWLGVGIASAVALIGAVAALVFAAVAGMDANEMGNLAGMLAPSIAITGIAAALATPMLAQVSTRRRLIGVVLLASVVGLVNLAVLTQLMYVGGPDVDNVAIIFIYSTAAGAGVALAVSRGSVAAIERLEDTARRIADGDLEARTGPIDAEPEIQMLARTLDEMAARLAASVDRERELESQRRDMVAAMSHDLKTPLASLRAMVEAIDDGVVSDPATVSRYHHEMRGSVATLVEMIDDLFKLSSLETGDLESRSERVPLDQIVNAALAATSGQAAEKGVEIVNQLGSAATEACSPSSAGSSRTWSKTRFVTPPLEAWSRSMLL